MEIETGKLHVIDLVPTRVGACPNTVVDVEPKAICVLLFVARRT